MNVETSAAGRLHPEKVSRIQGVQRIVLILVLLALSALEAARAGAAPMPSWTRTRPLSPSAIKLLANATERSSIVITLLQELEQTDIVVYLTDLKPGAVGGPKSYLSFLSLDASTRYLLVRIDHWQLSPRERIVLLGHELQHALEVAAAPEVRDAAGLAQLYRRIGWESEKDRFESEGAKAMGNRVRKQLSRHDPDIAHAHRRGPAVSAQAGYQRLESAGSQTGDDNREQGPEDPQLRLREPTVREGSRCAQLSSPDRVPGRDEDGGGPGELGGR